MRPPCRAALALIAIAFAVPEAGAQTQNQAATGSGGVLQALDRIQAEYDKQWAGPPGQVLKGSAAMIGLVQALAAAKDAVSIEGAVNRAGESVPSGASSGGVVSTTTGTSSTTSSTATATN